MWLWYQFTTKPKEKIPPWYAKSRYMSAAPSHGIIAASDGGFRLAASHWVIAKYEIPLAPTRPLHQRCRAAHSIASEKSRASLGEKGSVRPGDCPVPRVSMRSAA